MRVVRPEPVLPIRAVARRASGWLGRLWPHALGSLARIERVRTWVEELPASLARGAEAPPTKVASRAPTPFHDLDAPPVSVAMRASVYRRLVREFLAHLDGPDGELETGWIPVGRVEPDRVAITSLLPKGPNARASEGDFEIDQPFVLAVLVLARTRASLDVLGLVHSHPGRMSFQSTTDRDTDSENVSNLMGGAGVYPIVTRDDLPEARPAAVASGARVTFYAMRATTPGIYVPCEVEFVEGPDEGAWLVPFEPALGACSGLVMALARDERLDVSLQECEGVRGALDVVVRADGSSALARYAPALELVAVSGPRGTRRLDPGTARGARLASKIRGALLGATPSSMKGAAR